MAGGRSIPATNVSPAQQLLIEAVNELNGVSRKPNERAVRLSELMAAGLVMKNEKGIIRSGEALQTIEKRLFGIDGYIEGFTRGYEGLVSTIAEIDGKLVMQTEDITALQTNFKFLSGDNENQRLLIEANSEATRQLTSRVEFGENYLDVLSRDVTDLQASATIAEGTLSFLNNGVDANASAVSTLEARVTVTEDTIEAHSSQITDLEASVNVLPHVYLQATAPTGGSYIVGDMWLDSDDGNKVHVWDGSAWGEAVDLVGATIYAQAASPSIGGLRVGDLWFDTDDNMKQWRWDGTQWVLVTDPRIEATATAVTSLDARVVLTENSIISHSSRLTTLENTVNHPTTGVAATAAAVSSLDSRVDATEASITSQSSSITTLNNQIANIGGDNLLINGGLEDDSSSNSLRAFGWGGSANIAGYTLSKPASPLANSTYSRRIDHAALTNGAYLEFPLNTGEVSRRAVVAGKSYVYSVYARGTTTGTFKAYIQFFNSSNTLISTASLPDTTLSDTTFTRITLPTTAPANAVAAHFYAGRLINSTGATAAMWLELDNAMFQEGTVATAFQNGSADYAREQATSSAISSLDSRVTSAEGTLTSQSSSITSLTSSITNKDFLAGAGTNLLRNDFSTFTAVPPTGSSNMVCALDTTNKVFKGSLKLTTQNGSAWSYIGLLPGDVYLTPGKYIISAWLRCSVAGKTSSFAVRLGVSPNNVFSTAQSAMAAANTWERHSGSANVTVEGWYALGFDPVDDTGGTDWWLDGIMIEPQQGSLTTPSPYAEGTAQPQIDATSSAVSTLDARVTTTEAGITSYYASYKVALNANGVATGFTSETNGTTSAFKVQADLFQITSSTGSGSGQRFEYSAGNIRIYDASNVLRVRLGIW